MGFFFCAWMRVEDGNGMGMGWEWDERRHDVEVGCGGESRSKTYNAKLPL